MFILTTIITSVTKMHHHHETFMKFMIDRLKANFHCTEQNKRIGSSLSTACLPACLPVCPPVSPPQKSPMLFIDIHIMCMKSLSLKSIAVNTCKWEKTWPSLCDTLGLFETYQPKQHSKANDIVWESLDEDI
uniref:Uncharacterized protein n=1 Tax=Glossina austeni TaxID=7395 RepID=A0A1A9UGC5_GLOAU